MAEQDYACVGRGCQRAAMQTEIERLRAERAQQTKDEERLRYAIEIGAGTLRRLRAALEDVRERVQEIANRYHEQHFVIDTVARLLCETIPAALAGDAKHEVVRLGDGATYCPGCTVTFPVEIGPVVAGSGENIAGTFTVGPVVPAEAAPNILDTIDRLRAALRTVVKHWREFGPERGFDEQIERVAALAGDTKPEPLVPTGAGGNPRAFICCDGIDEHAMGCTASPASVAPAIPENSWSPGTGDEPSECLSGARSDAKSNIGPPLWDRDVVATLLSRLDTGADALDDRDCGYAGNLIRDALRAVQTAPPAGFNEKEQFVWRLGFAAGASVHPAAPALPGEPIGTCDFCDKHFPVSLLALRGRRLSCAACTADQPGGGPSE